MTFIFSAAELDALKFASPLYCALIKCVPDAKDLVANVAEPLLSATGPEMAVVPSKKVTVPEAFAGVTAARKVTGVPALKVSSFPAVVSVSVVLALATFTVSAADVAPLKFASPLYCAVMECDPAPRAEVLMEAVPALRGTLPEMGEPLSKKVTVPDALAGATLAVKVSELPNVGGSVVGFS